MSTKCIIHTLFVSSEVYCFPAGHKKNICKQKYDQFPFPGDFFFNNNFFPTKRSYLLDESEKNDISQSIVIILAKLQLCVMSSSTVYKMRGAQTLRNINHFIGGYNLFPAKKDIFAK